MPMTPEEMREATGLGPEWDLIWAGADRLDAMQHLCVAFPGPEGTYHSAWVRLPYEPTATPGVAVAKCARCRIAWVRGVKG